MARGTILIADDDTAIRTVLNQALARAGYAPARDRQRGDALALGEPGRGRRGHHRRGDAGRERLRSHSAHQEGAAGPADHRHERAEHADDGADGGRKGRLRISAEAVRSLRSRGGGEPRAGRAGAATASGFVLRDGDRGAAADRPLHRDAGNLSCARAPDADRSHGHDPGRERHRQGAGRARSS